MTSLEFRDRLGRRARRAGLVLAADSVGALEAYFRLLSKWNAKINLTALPLAEPTEQTFDRLLIEPLVAARWVHENQGRWVDIGSGGGSPAIPLKIMRPSLALTMVESRVRKAAFLREAIRTIGLTGATVSETRFDEFANRPEAEGSFDLITVRAVRLDRRLFDSASRLLVPGGRLFMFCPTAAPITAPGFTHVQTVTLADSHSHLAICERVFHVEHTY